MEKQKRWQLIVIIAVILLTIYNILPTLFFYTKPLKQPIDQKEASEIADQIAHRVNDLEIGSREWILAFSKNLDITPQKIELSPNDPSYYLVSFATPNEASRFSRFLPRAGSLIPFVPQQLNLETLPEESSSNQVLVKRRIAIHFPENVNQAFFTYSPKVESNGKITAFYQAVVYDRLIPLILGIAGEQEVTHQLNTALSDSQELTQDSFWIQFSQKLVTFDKVFGAQSAISHRYFASLFGNHANADTINKATKELDAVADRLTTQKNTIAKEQKDLKDQGKFLNPSQEFELKLIERQRISVKEAQSILTRYASLFKNDQVPLTYSTALAQLKAGFQQMDSTSKVQLFDIGQRSPFISQILIDWANDQIHLVLHKELLALQNKPSSQTEVGAYQAEKVNQLLINEIATLAQTTDEKIAPSGDGFLIDLNQLTGSQSLLTLNLGEIASLQSNSLKNRISTYWHPQSKELSRSSFPIWDYQTYQALPSDQKQLGLLVYAPAAEKTQVSSAFRKSSIYVVAKGLQPLIQYYIAHPDSAQAKEFSEDIRKLNELLQQEGFFGYSAIAYGLPSEFKQDYLFELDNYYDDLLKATREQFTVHGSKQYAVLEFTDVEQRILTVNKIDDQIHDDLLKWKDSYQAAQVNLNLAARYDVPHPTQNVYWSNFVLSTKKYFRGDNRKILKWGLDLSGGKTVRIGLKDRHNRTVTEPEDLREAVNELYKRVNKMGVSEVGIRIEGENIVLDFPGSQGLSASELVQASSMTFHVVNEKFTPNNSTLGTSVNQFLQNVWNEAVVTNRKDIESINRIAFHHLVGTSENPQEVIPQSEAARTLYENGLKLANPKELVISSAFDDTLSSIGVLRGDSFTEWQGQSHPLVIIFKNYALDGASLTNIHAGYDPSKGNILSFGVASAATGPEGQTIDPREDFYNWTSQFSQEKIAGTPKENYSRGEGWRMAVILNGTIISSPTLNNALRDQAMISGHFSQREITQLAADLKAGSLSFTPQILSEQNVSPELGKEERTKSISAAFIGTALVIITMILYYHFAGAVASVAVLFNLLIMWGILQNLDAALTLPGIAAIILVIGTAVDANVLVYERIREEFAISKRLPSAVQAGYRKAFSAIIDSNITTIIAALILLQFDSGPIKGFAVTLIVGIVSSMFTALFMTRYYFAGWVQNPAHKVLKMSQFIGKTSFNFLSKAKMAAILSAIVFVIGAYALFANRHTILGMDFTGGYALTVELQEKPGINYRTAVLESLKAHGASSGDVQVRELNHPNALRIQLGMTMEQPGHPFHDLPKQVAINDLENTFEHNPRITWVVNSLAADGLFIQKDHLHTLDQNWSEMSGQLSDTMRNNAIIGMGLALFCILIYISIRFEFNYGISAILGLIYDVLMTLAVLGLFKLFGVTIQIDLQAIAALMTIIGYSLNDTIIIFDRIREDLRVMRKIKFSDVVNHALNATLSRTIMTSGTTLLVLLALVVFGGTSIFDFSLIMTIGVVVGTLSSLFIAAPLILYFHNREVRGEEEKKAPMARIRAPESP